MKEAVIPLEGLAAIGNMAYGTRNTGKCNDIHTQYVQCADQTGCGVGLAANAWDYQECTDFVYEIVTNNVTDMFPPRQWLNSNLTEYCEAKFGVTPQDEWMRLWYPALPSPEITS